MSETTVAKDGLQEDGIPSTTVEIHNHLDGDNSVVLYDTPQLGSEAVEDFGPAAAASRYLLLSDEDDPLQVSIQWNESRVIIHYYCEADQEREAQTVLCEVQNGSFGKGGAL